MKKQKYSQNKQNKSLFIILTSFLLFTFSFLPTVASAQQEGAGDSHSNFNQWGRWGQSSEMQQKIAALPSVADPVVKMPVLFGVSVKDISPNFGDPRPNGRTHLGEDIMAVSGTPIVSPTKAVVLRVETGVSEGNAVYTANPGGETFVYMHLDHFGEGVVSGSVLEAGSLIGYVGNTGDASAGAAHLHFEIHDVNGTATNPFPRLTGEFTVQEKMTFLSKFTTVATVPVTSEAPLFSRNLYKGMTHEDVRTLQKLLNAKGFTVSTSGAGSVGNETDFFGSATQAAVIKFQIAKNISPAVGYVGPITRSILN